MKKLIIFAIIALFVLTTFVYAEGFLEHLDVIGVPGADSLTNIDIGRFEGKQADYRFTASHTGDVEAVTIFLIYKIPGYAAGDGGDVLVELKTDDGTGLPSETVLASYLIEDPMAENFPVVYFDQTAHLEEGEVYHIEFSNPAPDPVNNYVGVDVLFDARRAANSQPHYTDEDYAVLWKPSGNYDWQLSEGTIPVFSIHFTDGTGQGIGYMDAFAKWEVDRYYVSGDEQIRETMEFPADKTIDSMNVRVKKVDESGPLTVVLEHDDGTVLEECTFAAEEIEPDRDWSGQDFDHNMVWIGCDFEPTTLLAGETYNLVLKSIDGNYFTVGVQDGAHVYNFHPDSVFDEGDFQYSLNGGDTWSDYRHSDVQFYFNMAEEEPVPVCTDDDQDGYYLEGEGCEPVDCNDNDDTLTEEIPYYADVDEDGLGDPNNFILECSLTPPIGYVNNNNDQDDNDNGMDDVLIVDTGSSGITNMIGVLEDTYNVDLITIEDVMLGVPAGTEVLVWPGGVSFLSEDYVEYTIFPFEVFIDQQITSSLQAHVNSGGGYVGICAGSIVGTSLLETDVQVQDIYPEFPFPVTITEVGMAGLLDANAVDYLEWYDNYAYNQNNIGTLTLYDHPIIGDYDGDYMDYFGGPVFKDLSGDVEVLATFTQQLQPALYNTVDAPAIVVQDNVVLSSNHPEYDAETQPVFFRMVQYANGELEDVECTDDNECDAGYTCDNYVCVYNPDCEDDNECDAGYTCDNYVCVYNPDCEDDNECDAGYTCDNYVCVFNPECALDSDCDAGYTCDNYICVFNPECALDSDCDAGYTCDNYVCIYNPECEYDEECDQHYSCQNYECVFSPECTIDNECDDQLDYTDNTCENNECIYTLQEEMCYDATNCDDQLDFTDNTCEANTCTYTLQEGACYDATNCDEGYECMNNVCTFVEPECVDNDGDGYYLEEDCSPVDCNDNDASIAELQTYYLDNDGDGYGDIGAPEDLCAATAPTRYTTEADATDCDDTEPLIHEPQTYYVDADQDGYGDPNNYVEVCIIIDPLVYVLNGDDCDDTEVLLHEPVTFYADEDNDGYGNPDDFVLECELSLEGYVLNPDDEFPFDFDNDGFTFDIDCNDLDPLLSVVTTFYTDADLDTYGDVNSPEDFCLNEAPEGFTTDFSDCDDGNDQLFEDQLYYADLDGDGLGDPNDYTFVCSLVPPIDHVYNADDLYPIDFDNDAHETEFDCDDLDATIWDEVTYYADADLDIYGDINTPEDFCLSEAPTGFTTDYSDCDDTEALLHEPLTFYADEDGDGYGNPNDFVLECELYLEGHELNADDEYPNDFDNDGVITIDDCNDFDPLLSVVTTFYTDADLDTYGDVNSPEDFCLNEAPEGFTTDTTDCDDTNADLYREINYYLDNDGDGYGDPTNFVTVCSLIPPEGYVDNNLDDDDNPVEYLSYEISGDNVDNDGDGIVDEYNTLAENGEHPVYGDTNPGSRNLYSQSVVSVEGIEDGDIRVTYEDNSIYIYDIFDVSTNDDTKIYSSGPRGYFYTLHPTDRKMSLVNIYTGDTLWTNNLPWFLYNWLDSWFYTEI